METECERSDCVYEVRRAMRFARRRRVRRRNDDAGKRRASRFDRARCLRLFTVDSTLSAQSSNPSRSARRLLLISNLGRRPVAVYRALRLTSLQYAKPLAALALVFGYLAVAPVAAVGDRQPGTTYFLDSRSGSDTAAGTSSARAWT